MIQQHVPSPLIRTGQVNESKTEKIIWMKTVSFCCRCGLSTKKGWGHPHGVICLLSILVYRAKFFLKEDLPLYMPSLATDEIAKLLKKNSKNIACR